MDDMARDKIGIVGVVGGGTLGTQIAAHLMHCGQQVVLRTRYPENASSIVQKVDRHLSRYPEDQRSTPGKLAVVTNLSELSGCSTVIEAVAEDKEVKRQVLKDIEDKVGIRAYIFTNSSSISIDDLSKVLNRPERFLGYHLFNPVGRMSLVEIVVGGRTGESAILHARELARLMGKDPVIVNNSPGFIVNRLLLWQINEAARMVEEGVSTVFDIDKAVHLGLNHPLGPFQLADLIGLDVCLSILDTLDRDLGLPGYRPSSLIRDMVVEGKLGKKTGIGFYDYRAKGA